MGEAGVRREMPAEAAEEVEKVSNSLTCLPIKDEQEVTPQVIGESEIKRTISAETAQINESGVRITLSSASSGQHI